MYFLFRSMTATPRDEMWLSRLGAWCSQCCLSTKEGISAPTVHAAIEKDTLEPPYIIGVCGASCSGKTTIASKLAEELNALKEVGIAQNTEALSGDDFFVFDQYCTDSCPTKKVHGRVWKDWESVDAIDWHSFTTAVEKARRDPACPTYIVIEGFLLLATPESRALFDATINVKLSKEECWRRRRGRAEKMKGLPPGFSSGEEEKNYEVLETYVKTDADRGAFLATAAARYPDEGELAWLRLYFDEVVWPAAEDQQNALEACRGSLPVLELNADIPTGKEEWREAHFPAALNFVRQQFARH